MFGIDHWRSKYINNICDRNHVERINTKNLEMIKIIPDSEIWQERAYSAIIFEVSMLVMIQLDNSAFAVVHTPIVRMENQCSKTFLRSYQILVL